VFHETPPAGPLNEREAIYRSLVDECEAAEAGAHENGDDGDEGPTDFACLACGTVTTADERPDSCPDCHRTAGDRGGAALFQVLD
jgi:rubrerythrin